CGPSSARSAGCGRSAPRRRRSQRSPTSCGRATRRRWGARRRPVYAIVAGGGKVGANVTRSLVRMGHEVTLVEQRRDRFEQLEAELGPVVVAGDATEIFVLERAGIARPPDLVVAVTGDDEDNIVI